MKNIIAFLESRRELTISLVLTYFIFVLFMHDFVVKLSVWLMNMISREKYDLIIGAIMLVSMVSIISLFIKNLRTIKHAKDIKLSYMLLMTGLIIIHTQVNFVMNIEIIHTLQFGIIALLIFSLTRSFGAALYYTVLLGAVDELFQYAILYPERNDYLDFNDIVLDQLGAAIMLVYLFSTGERSYKNETVRWYQSPVLVSALLIAVTTGLLFHFSIMSMYFPVGSAKPLFILNEALGPEGFWRHVPNANIVYHVMTPQEGMIVMLFICGLFFLLDYLDKNSLQLPNEAQFDSGNKVTPRNENNNSNEHLTSSSASSVLPLPH